MFDTGDESRKAKHGIINSSGLPKEAGSYTETSITYSRAVNAVPTLRPIASPKGGETALERS